MTTKMVIFSNGSTSNTFQQIFDRIQNAFKKSDSVTFDRSRPITLICHVTH